MRGKPNDTSANAPSKNCWMSCLLDEKGSPRSLRMPEFCARSLAAMALSRELAPPLPLAPLLPLAPPAVLGPAWWCPSWGPPRCWFGLRDVGVFVSGRVSQSIDRSIDKSIDRPMNPSIDPPSPTHRRPWRWSYSPPWFWPCPCPWCRCWLCQCVWPTAL